MGYFDLHRHDEFSLFDGFDKPERLAKIAKDLGYDALGISNHGSVSGLVQHYFACKENEIKPVMGIETYFVPKWNEENKTRGYHLCLFIKNNKGYNNLNRMLYESEVSHKYYNAEVTFEQLEKYHEGLICSSACIGSFTSQLIVNDNVEKAEKALKKFIKIFGDDFYIEIQPYELSEKGLQEKVNVELIRLARKLNIKCVFTSDSHFGLKEDFDTYLKMHDIAGHLEMGKGYHERYMPTQDEVIKRFAKMHGGKSEYKVDNAKEFAKSCINNLDEIKNKIDDGIFDNFVMNLPTFNENKDSDETVKKLIIRGLKKKEIYNKQYVDRAKEELEVIKMHGFSDYFLMVRDYVRYARKIGINVGPGRGSVCNCLTAYALDITEVDSIKYGLDYRRFLRKDKKKMPDIDLDFGTSGRSKVIDYLIERYKGKSAQICSYGMYKVDNLINDLAKVCGLPTTGDIDNVVKNHNKTIIADIKKHINKFVEESEIDIDALMRSDDTKFYNKQYDDIIKHFSKLYKKIRFIGTHAAGVAITGGDIFDFTTLRYDKTQNKYYTVFDLNDMEKINVLKFDILGLRTMDMLGELEQLTDDVPVMSNIVDNKKLLRQFREGNTDGIFQFEKKTAKGILGLIETDCFEDIIAASSMNRPGPLSLKIPELYAHNKLDGFELNPIYGEYVRETYGTLIYQEQIQKLCVNIGNMEWSDADKVYKMSRGGTEKAVQQFNANYDKFWKVFYKGAKQHGLDKDEAFRLFDSFFNYTFNKGHSTGYSLISMKQMYYKVKYPTEFWFVTLKYANEHDYGNLSAQAVKNGCVILLPHVNGNAKHSIDKIDGDVCIREGTSTIKNVGLKAAEFIEQEKEENGPYKDYYDFMERIEPYKRVINKRVIDALDESGALEFSERKYYDRCSKYNIALYSRA